MAAPGGARRQPLLLLLLGKRQGQSEGPRGRRDYKGSGGCAVGSGGMGGCGDGVLGEGRGLRGGRGSCGLGLESPEVGGLSSRPRTG